MVIDDAWVSQWVAAVDGTPVPAGIPDAVVAWSVHHGPSWWLRIVDGAVRAGRGEVEDPAVVLATDAATAAALYEGRVSIEGAVLDGRLTVSGDVTLLPALRAAFDAVAEAARS